MTYTRHMDRPCHSGGYHQFTMCVELIKIIVDTHSPNFPVGHDVRARSEI